MTHSGDRDALQSLVSPTLPVSHQPWETDSLAFIHVGVILSHKGALDPEGPDHCAALERLRHVGTHEGMPGRLQASELARGGHVQALKWDRWEGRNHRHREIV